MDLVEIYDTRHDLVWQSLGDEYVAEFEEDGITYGIVVTTEEAKNLHFGRVDFHVKEPDGSLRFNASEASPKAYTVLGVIANGVVERFGNLDGVYLVAKKALYPAEYEQQVRLYGKIANRLHLKLGLGLSFIERPTESIFILTRNKETLDALHYILGYELKGSK
jgi:hypothetical protein